MSKSLPVSSGEHPLDIYRMILSSQAETDPCALVTVVDILGRTARSLGFHMAVSKSGRVVGYLSNGCIDAAVVAACLEAMRECRSRRERYGQGSPYLDLKLACGGGLEVLITPNPDPRVVAGVVDSLERRQPIAVDLDDQGTLSAKECWSPLTGWSENGAFQVSYTPRLRLQTAGRGQELLALASVARAAGLDVICQSPDASLLPLCAKLGCTVRHLASPKAIPAMETDPWTAVVLMFHEHEWEPVLLRESLAGNPFYIGALGSSQTHRARLRTLQDLGFKAIELARIRGPIGLVPSMRNASMLAISTLAEIIDCFVRASSTQSNCVVN